MPRRYIQVSGILARKVQSNSSDLFTMFFKHESIPLCTGKYALIFTLIHLLIKYFNQSKFGRELYLIWNIANPIFPVLIFYLLFASKTFLATTQQPRCLWKVICVITQTKSRVKFTKLGKKILSLRPALPLTELSTCRTGFDGLDISKNTPNVHLDNPIN